MPLENALILVMFTYNILISINIFKILITFVKGTLEKVEYFLTFERFHLIVFVDRLIRNS